MTALRVVHDAWNATDLPAGGVVTIGKYDALHRGHQEILQRVVQRAGELRCEGVVISFEPGPDGTTGGSPPVTTSRQRRRLLEAAGLDHLLLIRFDEAFSRVESETFVADFLHRRLRAREVIVGDDFRFGHARRGDARLLGRLGEQHGIAVGEVGQVEEGGERISSTRIRRLVAAGELEEAELLLGRPYVLEGVVRRGSGRGAELGWPTANLELRGQVVPGSGVYVGRLRRTAGILWHPAAVNVGVRPTFGGGDSEPVVEAHVLDLQGDLYGEEIELAVLRRLREERRFPDLGSLSEQIARDVEAVREYFRSVGAEVRE